MADNSLTVRPHLQIHLDTVRAESTGGTSHVDVPPGVVQLHAAHEDPNSAASRRATALLWKLTLQLGILLPASAVVFGTTHHLYTKGADHPTPSQAAMWAGFATLIVKYAEKILEESGLVFKQPRPPKGLYSGPEWLTKGTNMTLDVVARGLTFLAFGAAYKAITSDAPELRENKDVDAANKAFMDYLAKHIISNYGIAIVLQAMETGAKVFTHVATAAQPTTEVERRPFLNPQSKAAAAALNPFELARFTFSGFKNAHPKTVEVWSDLGYRAIQIPLGTVVASKIAGIGTGISYPHARQQTSWINGAFAGPRVAVSDSAGRKFQGQDLGVVEGVKHFAQMLAEVFTPKTRPAGSGQDDAAPAAPTGPIIELDENAPFHHGASLSAEDIAAHMAGTARSSREEDEIQVIPASGGEEIAPAPRQASKETASFSASSDSPDSLTKPSVESSTTPTHALHAKAIMSPASLTEGIAGMASIDAMLTAENEAQGKEQGQSPKPRSRSASVQESALEQTSSSVDGQEAATVQAESTPVESKSTESKSIAPAEKKQETVSSPATPEQGK